MAILERFLALSEHGAEAARTLGTLYEEAGDVDRAIEYLDRSLDVDPYDLDAQAQLAALYESRANYQQAILHRRAVVSLNPVDLATAYYDLAHSLYEAQHIAEAKRATLQALEIAPGFRDAQKLLLKCVDEPR
jgi:tetratricopeptide (TPR) repeat protein